MGKLSLLMASVMAFTAGMYVGIAHRDMVLSYAQRWEPQTTAITKTLKTKTKETLANIKNEPAPKKGSCPRFDTKNGSC